MINPDARIAKSTGIDRPVMYTYLAGRIAGNCMDKCIGWRQDIINHYKNYKKVKQDTFVSSTFPKEMLRELSDEFYYESYPISFLCPLNSGESKTADALGLKSHLSPNMIYAKDILSLEKADVIVVNVEDYFEVGIEKQLGLNLNDFREMDLNTIGQHYSNLVTHIKNRRENFGTICEFAISLYLQKPIILICPEARKNIYENHPFAKRASVIVTSVKQLLDEKHLQTLYKSIAGAVYD